MAQAIATTFGATSTTEEVLSGIDLRGKRILVTGVSAGLGIETARSLAAHGAHVVGAARDLAKAETATAQVKKDAAANGGGFELIELDLANLKSVRAAAAALLNKGKFFDVIIANAGVMATPFGHTVDGFETQFGTNHLGHFVFVNRIAPLLRSGGRLINLSSSGHRYGNVDLDDPNFEHTPYEPFVAYGHSKTANILFAVAFDRRHRNRNVRAAAVHPGGIRTELGRCAGRGGESGPHRPPSISSSPPQANRRSSGRPCRREPLPPCGQALSPQPMRSVHSTARIATSAASFLTTLPLLQSVKGYAPTHSIRKPRKLSGRRAKRWSAKPFDRLAVKPGGGSSLDRLRATRSLFRLPW